MIKAEIVAHSLSPQGDELISVLCTFPRIILAEVNTHRMLSKNTSSSRAIPFKKMVEAVQNDPFIPIAWQKEHTGMQGYEYFTDNKQIQSKINCWLSARNNAIKHAKFLNSNLVVHEIGKEEFISYNQFDEDSLEGLRAKERLSETKVTKQLCNRLLEPFMWTTMLITGSKEGWDNFFHLRCPQYEWRGELYKSIKDIRKFVGEDTWTGMNYNYSMTEQWWRERNKGQAEIHIMDLAEKIYDAVNESTPKQLQVGQWHIPFEDKIRDGYVTENLTKIYFDKNIPPHEAAQDILLKTSVAMAARTSYTVVGDEKEIDYSKMIELHDRLLSQDPPHSSPLEHCARAMSDEEYYTFVKGRIIEENKQEDGTCDSLNWVEASGWCNNLKGFIPYRYFIDNKIEL